VGLAALAIAGLVLSFFTFGAAAAATAVVEEGVGDTLVATDLTVDTVLDTASTFASGADAAEPASSVSFGYTLPEGWTGTAKLANLTTQVVTNTMFGVGASGFQYDCRPAHDFTGKGFREALACGAVSGAIFGVMSFGASFAQPAIAKIPSLLGRIGVRILLPTAEGAISNDVSQIITNAVEHQPWAQGLAQATWIGAAEGGVFFGIGDVLANERGAISDSLGSLRRGGSASSGVAGSQAQAVNDPANSARLNAQQQRINPSLMKSFGTFQAVPPKILARL
jgi:hypothetical protein